MKFETFIKEEYREPDNRTKKVFQEIWAWRAESCKEALLCQSL